MVLHRGTSGAVRKQRYVTDADIKAIKRNVEKLRKQKTIPPVHSEEPQDEDSKSRG